MRSNAEYVLSDGLSIHGFVRPKVVIDLPPPRVNHNVHVVHICHFCQTTMTPGSPLTLGLPFQQLKPPDSLAFKLVQTISLKAGTEA
eukprot:jgi/Botrbrau1/15456/Bobra.43_2s0080.1